MKAGSGKHLFYSWTLHRDAVAVHILPIAKHRWLLGHLDIKSAIQGNILKPGYYVEISVGFAP